MLFNYSGLLDAPRLPKEVREDGEDAERYVVKATPMDQLNKVAADDSDADAVSKVGGEGKGVENVGDIDSDGSPRRFYHTVRVVYFSFKEPHVTIF